MTRMTQTKWMRSKWRGQDPADKPLKGYHPAQPRELVTCKCGRSKYLSVGQIWNCEHKE